MKANLVVFLAFCFRRAKKASRNPIKGDVVSYGE